MSNRQTQKTSLNVLPYLQALLIIGAFVHCGLYPGWASVAELLLACGFTCFVMWLDPFKAETISAREFEELCEKTKSLEVQLNNLRFKLGLQSQARA